MPTRLFSLALGVISLAAGILALIPALYTGPPASAPGLDVSTSYGLFLGVFPVNAAEDVASILIGLAGIIASSRIENARYYCMSLFVVYGLASIFGFIPTLNVLGGLMPIYSPDTWVHAGAGILCGYFGFVALEPTYVEPAPSHAH